MEIGPYERSAIRALFVMAAFIMVSTSLRAAAPRHSHIEVTDRTVRTAVEASVAYLQQDATKWKKEYTCATCHQGAMTVWALNSARRRGFAVVSARSITATCLTGSEMVSNKVSQPANSGNG